MSNRFEQVDEAVDDAINVILEQRADGQWAKVACSRRAHPSLAEDKVSGDLPPSDALAGAVKLANELKLAIVVVDRDGVWKKQWGELYRAADADEST
jgi:hypothetical protein